MRIRVVAIGGLVEQKGGHSVNDRRTRMMVMMMMMMRIRMMIDNDDDDMMMMASIRGDQLAPRTLNLR